jgi:hypothetical protein
MTTAAAIDDRFAKRQFWLRSLLVVGLLWGFLPFITAPFITRGPNNTHFEVLASVVNSLTILPACALAFWHRRIACIWLTINAALIGSALATFIHRTGQFNTWMIVQVAGPILFALLLDFFEARRWPPAVNPRRRD